MADMTDRILSGDSVSDAVEELHEEQFMDALAKTVSCIEDTRESLSDIVGTGDPNRWAGIRRKAAAWNLVLVTLKQDLIRQHNSMAARNGEEPIKDDNDD